MLTTDELQQLGTLIETKLEAEREQTIKLVREEITASEKRLTQKLEEEAETMGEFFHETWAKMEVTNERVTNIEDNLGLTHRN